jgi:pimeloyl-ACP methyl ester carboxylesterase
MASITRPADREDSIFLPILPDGGELHVRVAGRPQLPALLLFHGAGADVTWRTWEPQIAALARVRRVGALDWPGWGQSAGRRPDNALDLTPGRMVDVALAGMAALGIGRADIGGVSWGGLIALELALRAPERVGKLLLVDAASRPEDLAAKRYAAVSHPTLLVWAREDPIIPVQIGRALAAQLPDCAFRIFEGSTHWPHHLHPDEFNELAVEFLVGQRRGDNR